MGSGRSTGSREQAPDLILADVVMPEKNGYEVCEAIKANPATARIPVILLSGTFEPFDRDRAERLGCDAIVSKPFDSQQLLRQVEALLAREPRDVPSASTMAIPIMAPDAAAPPAAPPAPVATPADRAPAEAGFASEDFTGSIPQPADIAGGPDLFEEEYGQADVESAIAAFEKAHPEFSFVEDAAATAAMVPGGADAADEDEARDVEGCGRDAFGRPRVAAGQPPRRTSTQRRPRPRLRRHPLRRRSGCRGSPSRSSPRSRSRPTIRPRSRKAEPAPDARRRGPDPGDPAVRGLRVVPEPGAGSAAPREPDHGRNRAATLEEHTAEIPIVEVGRRRGAARGTARRARRRRRAGAGAARDRGARATTSIGQLKEMLSSVSRPEGGLTDDEIDRLASRVVERLSEKIVREIAWEVIPDIAEIVIKQRIKELEAGVE